MRRKFSPAVIITDEMDVWAELLLFHVLLLNCCSFLDSGALAAETAEAYLHLLNQTQLNEVG